MRKKKVEYALLHAKLGFWVFRLAPNGKTPLKKGWQNEATRDPEKIKALWAEEPDANIGAFTSKFKDRACLVVDVDNKNGNDGDGSIIDLELAGKDFPKTATNITPTNGKHYIYQCAMPVKQGAAVLGPGLDIRSRGGYIVMAGSVLGGVPYVWSPAEVAEAPGWLYAKLSINPDLKQKRAVDASKIDPDRARKRAVSYLDDAPRPEEGSRNDTAFKVACELKDRGVDEIVCHELMVEWNAELETPLDDAELETLVGSAYVSGQEDIGVKAPETIFKPVEKKKKRGEHPIEKLNNEYAMVMMGGSHMILWETTDERGQRTTQFINEATFHKINAHRTIELGDKRQPLTKLWMADPERRTYQGLTFAPGRDCDARFYNLWKGWMVDPSDGSDVSDEAMEAFQNWLDVGLNVMCQGDAELFGWLCARVASIFQYPERKLPTACVFKGPKGTGKNSFIEPVAALVGPHAMLAANRRYLTSNFNSHLESLLILILDEANWGGDKEGEGILKDLITGTFHNIERKGLDPYKVANILSLFIIGNEHWLIPASADERRYAVFNVGTSRQKQTEFFIKMKKGLANGGNRLMLSFLLNYDITPYNLSIPPDTQGLIDQKHASLEIVEEYILDCLYENTVLHAAIPDTTFDIFPVDTFKKGLVAYAAARRIKGRIPDDRSVKRTLHKILPSMKKRRRRYGHLGLVYCYISPGVAQLRREWERYIGAKDGIDWNSEDDTGDLECLT